jgi:UDP-GlcNAc:undecaprenyl-phosphate GlcNAc-1-phosphate transferase
VISAILLLPVVAFLIAAPLTAVLSRLGRRLGTLDSPGAAGHDKVLREVPNIGGISIVAATLLPVAGGLLLLTAEPDSIVERLPPLEGYRHRVEAAIGPAWGLVACTLAIHLLGVWDDRRSLGPLMKLLVQAALAGVVAGLLDTRMLTMLDEWGVAGNLLSLALTVVWIVAVTNAINFLDNMDGLAGGIAAIAAAALLAATLLAEQWFVAAVLACLLGGLLGFLVFNVPPARIFMGDGGSLPVGFLLATLALRTTYVDAADPEFALGGAWYGVFMPLLVLAIPLYDLVAVSVIRLREGHMPWVGDQRHLSHRLLLRGMTPWRAVLAIWALAAVLAVSGIVLGSLRPWQAVLVGGQALAALGVLAMLERFTESGTARDRS